MLVDIYDPDALGSVSPSVIESYLRANNWYEIRRQDEIVSIWEYNDSSIDKHRVWLPLNVSFADYSLAIGRLLKTLAELEKRSQLHLLEDLGTIGVGDVIRAGTWDELNRGSGSIPFDDGTILLRRAHSMARAAAWATVEKRAVYPYRSANEVISYMSRLRLGQTERGSYLVKLISPISLPSEDGQMALPGMPDTPDTPFERKVVLNLYKGLDALHKVAESAHRRGSFMFEPFQEVVNEGVSANLCEAIIGVSEEQPSSLRIRPLTVSISWSYVFHAPENVTTKTVSFTQDHIPHIREAARLFRAKNPQEVSIDGYVISLKRQNAGDPGEARVLGKVDGRMRTVRIILPNASYNEAVRAHGEGFRVTCFGELLKQGNFYTLQNPGRFQVIEQTEESVVEQGDLFG